MDIKTHIKETPHTLTDTFSLADADTHAKKVLVVSIATWSTNNEDGWMQLLQLEHQPLNCELEAVGE